MIEAALGFLALLSLILLRVPVAFAMIITGICGFGLVIGWKPALISGAQTVADTTNEYSLSVIPLFLLMGNFITRAGLSSALYDVSYTWMGHRKGGLARATIVSCAGFAAVCGSSLATTATMAKVALPEMNRLGYSKSLAAGAIAAGGTLGILIPPSVIMVLYGILTQTDIASLFIAGIIPGLLGIILYNLAVSFVTHIDPEAGPAGPHFTWEEKFQSLSKVWEVLLLFVVVIGGIYIGLFTPTEAAGIGAFGAFLSVLVRRAATIGQLFEALFDTVVLSASIFMILIGALIFSNFLNMTAMPSSLGNFVADKGLSPMMVMTLILIIYIFLGTILDSISMILLTIPLFFPLVDQLGFDPVWFGIIVVVITEISLITPPIGMNIFVLSSTAPDLPISTIYRGVLPFVAADLVRLVLLLLIPGLSLFLPTMMN